MTLNNPKDLSKPFVMVSCRLQNKNIPASARILYAGEWCIPSVNDEKSLDYEVLPFLWSDKKKINEAFVFCDSVYLRVLEIIVPRLNKSLSANYTREYWEKIIGPWLYQYVQIMFDKYKSIQEASKKYPDLQVLTISDKDFQTIFKHGSDYNDDIFNLQLFSIVAKYLNMKTITHDLEIKNNNNIFSKKLSFKGLFLFKITSILNSLFSKRKIFISDPYLKSRPLSSLVFLVWFSKFSLIYNSFYKGYKFFYKKNSILRETLSEFSQNEDEFTNLVIGSFKFNFPALYLEMHDDFREHVQSYSRINIDMIFSSTGLWSSEEFKFLIADQETKMDSNFKIAYAQHGGNYGTDKNSMPEKIERRLSDIFLTYGWSGPGTRVLLQQDISKTRRKQTIPVLLVLTAPSRHFVMFQHISSSSRAIRNLSNTIGFLNKIDSDKSILVRDHPGMERSGWHEKESLLKEVPLIKFSESSDFYKQIHSCRIIVFNHMHTAYLETLAANIPTIIFIPWDDYDFVYPADLLIEQLIKAKIIFTDFEEAANHLNNYYEDPSDWWEDSFVQSARKNFCDSYFSTTENWYKTTALLLNDLCDQKIQ